MTHNRDDQAAFDAAHDFFVSWRLDPDANEPAVAALALRFRDFARHAAKSERKRYSAALANVYRNRPTGASTDWAVGVADGYHKAYVAMRDVLLGASRKRGRR